MKVEANKVVTFHYTVGDGSGGEPADTSRGREPLAVLIGHNSIIPGLESALIGHETGDRFEVSVGPEQAYGDRREDFVQRVPKKYFKDVENLRPGMTTVLHTKEGGPRPVTIGKIGSSVIDVDLNHPMAGKTLQFDIEITDVRDAAPEEIAHGHVHTGDGHAH